MYGRVGLTLKSIRYSVAFWWIFHNERLPAWLPAVKVLSAVLVHCHTILLITQHYWHLLRFYFTDIKQFVCQRVSEKILYCYIRVPVDASCCDVCFTSYLFKTWITEYLINIDDKTCVFNINSYVGYEICMLVPIVIVSYRTLFSSLVFFVELVVFL
jgi:hypothetical protein